MSCTDPHDLDCAKAIEHLDEFLDCEVDLAEAGRIRAHLDACGPCLHEFDVERIIKALVARSCGQRAPSELRDRVVTELMTVRVSWLRAGAPPAPGEGSSEVSGP